MMRRGWTVLIGAIVVFALAIGFANMPVPYVALGPGTTLDVLGTTEIKGKRKPIISIDGANVTKSKGHLNMTTVSVMDQIDIGTALRFWFDDDVAVVPREMVYPPGKSKEEADKESVAEFVSSQQSAEVAALRALGYEPRVVVKKLDAGSPAIGKLNEGDVITAVDGQKVTSGQKFVSLVNKHRAGDTIALSYQRGDATAVAEVTTKKTKSSTPQLKFTVEQEQPHPFEVDFDLGGIGGPSAGLMFALAIIDKIEKTDLTGGTFIAGTGEIDDEGNVGEIGGISQKLISAKRAGATVFLVPEGNCSTAAKSAPRGLKLVEVSTLDDALRALRILRDGGGQIPLCKA